MSSHEPIEEPIHEAFKVLMDQEKVTQSLEARFSKIYPPFDPKIHFPSDGKWPDDNDDDHLFWDVEEYPVNDNNSEDHATTHHVEHIENAEPMSPNTMMEHGIYETLPEPKSPKTTMENHIFELEDLDDMSPKAMMEHTIVDCLVDCFDEKENENDDDEEWPEEDPKDAWFHYPAAVKKNRPMRFKRRRSARIAARVSLLNYKS
ncbi:hypothetical protein FE257_010610 [Aspergillus nanangensis]|uniref:Uncharacterized protein n=1 Tax=Aspergillus nanangensis TaxID=2582783 RepID=A0AAD4GR30_ASPNN|nr:hypothetical protein FE257_010610 [Aspergillus nanangensis]